MPEATSDQCVKAFLRHWVRHWGLPVEATSDNGNTFIAKMWKGLHEALGTIVTYTPLYSPASLGLAERQHREIKHGLKACLLKMANENHDKWMDCLPWVLLNRRTVYQPALQASAAEMTLGFCPKIPGDLTHEDGLDLPDLLAKLRTNAAQPPAPTQHHRHRPVHFPQSTQTCTHVYVRKGKPSLLGPPMDGPYKIIERKSDSTLKLLVGHKVDGTPRYELHTWANCQPMPENIPEFKSMSKPTLGRKPKNKEVAATSEMPNTQL